MPDELTKPEIEAIVRRAEEAQSAAFYSPVLKDVPRLCRVLLAERTKSQQLAAAASTAITLGNEVLELRQERDRLRESLRWALGRVSIIDEPGRWTCCGQPDSSDHTPTCPYARALDLVKEAPDA